MKPNKKNKFKSAPKDHLSMREVDDLEDEYKEAPKWYEEETEEPKTFSPVTEQVLIELKDEAKKCHDAEVANYKIKNSKTNSNYQWMKTVMNSGTVSDRIAAHTVAIQDSPVCGLETLRNLVNMVKVGKKKECFTVMETLTELFLSDLLKPDQKLKPFHSKPLSALNDISSGNAIKRRKILSRWYFEDELKEVYTSFVLALNRAAQDTVESNKEKAITAMFKLLCGNPEQEKSFRSIMSKSGEQNFSGQKEPTSSSRSIKKHILVSYQNPLVSEVSQSEDAFEQRRKLKPGEKKVIVIEKLKRSTSFDSTLSNYELKVGDSDNKRLVRGKLSPSCKKEIFIAKKKAQPDEDVVGRSLNYVCFSNNVL